MLLKNLVKALGEEFGVARVAEEAVDQANVKKVKKVQTLAKLSLAYSATPRAARITAAMVIFDWGYAVASEWVEANFSDGGSGDPV